jgi:hypothetical protein
VLVASIVYNNKRGEDNMECSSENDEEGFILTLSSNYVPALRHITG